MGPDSPRRGFETGTFRRDHPPTPADLRPGAVLGGRYRVESPLGRGGMGEVWQAFDLKLRVDVALKVVLPGVRADSRRVEMLRREVRAARDVASPHVCRVFDLVEVDGQELVSMEYVDGSTLQELLAARSPLDLVEARDLGTQMLAGLQAIHDAGLVHRDLKPANVMLTRSGRVTVMDFGLAKGLQETQSLAIAGTPPYMAPEALRGGEIGPRADLFAAGVMLAEMVHPDGVREQSALQALWDGLRRQPPAVPPGPWERVIRRAIAADPDERFVSAAEMARALGESGSAGAGRVEENPYPGLASFQEDQARFFFGRELEVESVWKKLPQMYLLAVIGPSGVGKSSFLRAGLLAARPDGWRTVVCTPGDAPFTSLGQALVPEFSGDTRAMRDLFRLHDVDRSIPLLHGWRQRGEHALLIVDQFEELFTLNPPQTRARFAELLGRLSVEADIHVLVAMRDDFFLLCQQHPPLRPLFSEPTPLAPLAAADVRRALVQPARLCGYDFESEALVDEMVAEVAEERGALPLVAFAAASLWERRDRGEGVISRRAYEEIGRVGGALARHAEATLERIGLEREPIVREIFRNLVTAQRTRVVRERDALLSVFDDREEAEEVLKALVDARLLTTFELGSERAAAGGEASRHRVEIVHESLLASWPRLVRWQTQDSDGAQIRDQLRQAADLWHERKRSDDLLWTGTAYQEFELWRQRYPGGLSDTEAAFAEAMVSRYRRQRRRRRLAVAGSFAALVAVLAVVGGLLVRSTRMERSSTAHRLRLLAEGVLAEDNTLALALATRSLELEDDEEGRLLALRALSRGPNRFVYEIAEPPRSYYTSCLAPDGSWFAVGGNDEARIYHLDGREPTILPLPELPVPFSVNGLQVSPDGDLLLGGAWLRDGYEAGSDLVASAYEIFLLWSAPAGELLNVWRADSAAALVAEYHGARGFLRPDPPTLILAVNEGVGNPWLWVRMALGSDRPVVLGHANTTVQGLREFYLDPTGYELVDWKGPDVFLFPLENLEASPPIPVGHHENQVNAVGIDRSGRLIASADRSGEVRVWPRDGSGRPLFSHRHQETHLRMPVFDGSGSRLAIMEGMGLKLILFDLGDSGAEPISLLPAPIHVGCVGFSPDDRWVVAQFLPNEAIDAARIWFYPLTHEYPVVRRVVPEGWDLRNAWFMANDARFVANRGIDELWLCDPLADTPRCSLAFRHPDERMLLEPQLLPAGDRILTGSFPNGVAYLASRGGDLLATCEGFQSWAVTAVRADGRQAAVGGNVGDGSGFRATIRLWDLDTGDLRDVDCGHAQRIHDLEYLPGERLLSASDAGLRLWDLGTGSCEVLSDRPHFSFDLLPAGRMVICDTPAGATLWNLEERTERLLPIPSADIRSLAISPDESFVVVGRIDGGVLYWPLDDGEPHMLLGHEAQVLDVKVSADGRRILAIAEDGMMRTWPVPQGPPLLSRPHAELLEILHAQTNLRVVADTEAEAGYRLEIARFDCWRNPPDW